MTTKKTSDEEFQEQITLTVKEEDLENFKRFDQFISKSLPKQSRTYLKKLFDEGFITSSQNLKMNRMPPVGTNISVNIPFPEDYNILAEDIPLEILYEDKHIIVLNKQENIIVHPAPGNWTGTLVNALLHHCKDLGGIGNTKRPGIVHRLDKGTTGVMVVAKDQESHEKLSDMFREHDLKRQYIAITFKKISPPAGTIKSFITRNARNKLKMTSLASSGKFAITHYKVLESFKAHTYVQLTLETGRTHQIRVHLSEKKKCAILNDHTYGNPNQQKQNLPLLTELTKEYPHPLLHAQLLEFKHPITGELLSFKTEPNEIFKKALEELRSYES